MTDEELKKVCDMNFRVLMLLGYGMALLSSFEDVMDSETNEKYQSWRKSINNIIYFDKPMELL